MPPVSLEAYGIQIRDKQQRRARILSNFNSNNDLIDLCELYLKQNSATRKDDNTQKAYHVERIYRSFRSLFGTIKSGHYGQSGDIVDVDVNRINYNKKVNEAELSPFYFCIIIPQDMLHGVILLQKSGVYGIKSVISKIIERRFNANFQIFNLDIFPMLPEKVIEELIRRGRLIELKLIRHSLPRDIVDALEYGTVAEDFSVELNIKAKSGKTVQVKNKIFECLKGERKVSEIIRINQLQNDIAKIVVKVDGKERTVNLGDFSRMRPSYSIDENLAFGDDGHPIFDSMP